MENLKKLLLLSILTLYCYADIQTGILFLLIRIYRHELKARKFRYYKLRFKYNMLYINFYKTL